jgi:hypothetical protein
MIDKAYRALDAIRRGEAAALKDLEAWVGALRTIRWAVQTDDGVSLTPAGQQAFADMARDRKLQRAA